MASVASYPSKMGSVRSILFTCTTDGSGDSTGVSDRIFGEVDRVVVVPGASVSAGMTIKISDETTMDILDSDGNTGKALDQVSTPTNLPVNKLVASALTCTIAGGGATKSILVYIYYR